MSAECSVHGLEPPVNQRGDGAAASSAWTARGAGLDLQSVVSFAARALCHSPHDIHGGLSVIPAEGVPEPVAATDDLPIRFDWLQCELAQGPSMDSVPTELVVSKDLAADDRWPDFGKLCFAVMNLRSMVMIRVPLASGDQAALSLCSTQPDAFDRMDVDSALRLARLAIPAIEAVMANFELAKPIDGHRQCSRLAMALGMVVARHRVDSSEAFSLLLDASYRANRTVLDVAREVAETGSLPAHTGEPPGTGHAETSKDRSESDQSGCQASPLPIPRASRGDALGRASAHFTSFVGGPELWGRASRTGLIPRGDSLLPAHQATGLSWAEVSSWLVPSSTVNPASYASPV